VAVMYLGRVVELADATKLYRDAKHPYTQALMSSIPSLDPMRKSQRVILPGDVPSPARVPPGCPFHTRCAMAMPHCREREPRLRPLESGHLVSCWLYEDSPGS
jgi:oligopeptide/dipeptide ABC transporter ATP-binding protein